MEPILIVPLQMLLMVQESHFWQYLDIVPVVKFLLSFTKTQNLDSTIYSCIIQCIQNQTTLIYPYGFKVEWAVDHILLFKNMLFIFVQDDLSWLKFKK